MNPVRKLEMQCTHAEFFRELPEACGNLPFEVIGERVVVHDHGREVHIKLRDEPIRHLGSLALPMEQITLKFIDYSEAEANKFLETFVGHVMRTGG